MGSSSAGSTGGIIGGIGGAALSAYTGWDPSWMTAAGAAAGQTVGDVAGGAGFKPTRTMTAGALGYGAGSGLQYGEGKGWWDQGWDADAPAGSTPQFSENGAIMRGGSGGGSGTPSGGGGFGSMLPYTALASGLQYLGAEANRKGFEQSQNSAVDIWKQNAFPNENLVNANMASANSHISARYEAAARKMDEDMAARGISPSSGIYQSNRAQLARSKMRDMATMANDLIKFQNTPTQAVPISTYGGQSGLAAAGDTMGGVLGMYAGADMYRGMRGY